MSWKDRLEPELKLTSPDGDKFTAKWTGDSRSLVKKLGIFEFPGLVGAVVQDLQVGASLHSMPFFFEGFNHDLEADRFYRSAAQRGLWTIIHPTKGQKTWQLMSIKEETQPITSGNITAFTSEWIEPIGVSKDFSIQQRSSSLRNKSNALKEKTKIQSENAADIIKPSNLTKLRVAELSAVGKIRKTLSDASSAVAEVNARVESVNRAIISALSGTAADALGALGQIQILIDLPAQVDGNLTTLLGYYGGLIQEAIGLSDAEQSEITLNAAAVNELVAVSALAAVADIVVLNPPATRKESLDVLTAVAGNFNSVMTGLDRSQVSLAGKEYTSQSETFNDTALLIASVSDLILKRSFDLATAKHITLNRHRTPTEIALTEGIDLDTLIATNALKSEEVLLLPPGRVVTVYL